MSGWLKAGLIGAAIVIGMKLVGVIPCLVCCALPLEWVAYGCIGALAGYWIPPVRETASAAGQGALAALFAAAVGGVVGVGLDLASSAVLGPAQLAWLDQVPREILHQWEAMGFDPRMFVGTGAGVVANLTTSSLCCGVSLAIGAGLGALGGLIFAAVRSE